MSGPTDGFLAHMAIQGMNELVNGILHPFATPSHALVLLSLALRIGQREPFTLQPFILATGIAAALALGLTTTGWIPDELPTAWPIAVALAIATLVALARQMPGWVDGLCAAIGATTIGLDSGVGPGLAATTLKTLTGTWLSLALAVPYLAIACSNAGSRAWSRVAVRVAGSWIIAISLLILADALRK